MPNVKVTILCVWLVLAGAAAAPAQEPPAEPKATLSIQNAMAPPEWELRVPVTLTVPDVLQIGRLKTRITYPTNMIDFQKVQATNTLKEAGYDLKVDIAKPTGTAGSVQVETVAAFQKGKRLPSGIIAILVFKVANDAKEGDSFALTAEDVHAWGLKAGSGEVKVVAEVAATVTVSPAGLPIFNCFFYMH